MHTERVRELLQGKTVAIVGGSDRWDRERADACDIVVRVNANWRRQGGRIDAVYTREVAPDDDYDLAIFVAFDMEADDEAWLGFCELYQIPFVQFYAQRFGGPNPYRPELEWLNEFNWRLGTLPLTGLLAIAHICQLVARPPFVTGFDFYAKDGAIPRAISSHEIPPQVAALDEWCRSGAILPDEALRELLAHHSFGDPICF